MNTVLVLALVALVLAGCAVAGHRNGWNPNNYGRRWKRRPKPQPVAVIEDRRATVPRVGAGLLLGGLPGGLLGFVWKKRTKRKVYRS